MQIPSLTSLFLPLLLPTLVASQGTPTADYVPDPVQKFQVQAYQSPFPLGQGLTGFQLVADAGLLWLTNSTRAISVATANLMVNNTGRATLVSLSSHPAQGILVYMEGKSIIVNPKADAKKMKTVNAHACTHLSRDI